MYKLVPTVVFFLTSGVGTDGFRDRFIIYRRPTFCVLVGLSFKLLLSFYKDYILVHRAIPKSLRLEYESSLLDFGPQGNIQIFRIGLSTGRNSNWTFYR